MEQKQNNNKVLKEIIMLVVFVATIIGGVVFITDRLSTLETKAEYLNQRLEKLYEFMDAGERFTRQDGNRLHQDLEALKKEVRTYPPQWFRNNFADLRNEVRELKGAIAQLNVHVTTLKLKMRVEPKVEDYGIGHE